MKRFLGEVIVLSCLLFMLGCNQTEESVRIYTEKDVYIHSYESGCLYGYGIPKTSYIVIETSEQLEYAVQNYGIYEFSSKCKEMTEQYAIENYTFILRYDEVSTAGYYIHVDKVKIEADAVTLIKDKKSHSPKRDSQPQEMGGFFHMVAIPKEYLVACDFSEMDVIFPGEDKED